MVQALAGMGGIQGFPARASRMAVKTAMPCWAAVEAYPRIAYRSRVVFSERSRPEIFCWVFDGRRSRSALCGYPDKADKGSPRNRSCAGQLSAARADAEEPESSPDLRILYRRPQIYSG
jgi:hypothetical protein